MRIVAILLGSVLFAGPALAQGILDGGTGGSVAGGATGPAGGVEQYSDGPKKKKVSSSPSDEAQNTAEQLRLQGQCDRAVPILRRLALRAGAEISQYNLGLCLLDLAKSAPGPDAADATRKEGAVWLLRSANAGFARAQAQAVVLYFDGTGVDRDPIEAEKWVLLHQHNAMRNILHLPDLAPELQSKVDAALNDAGRATAQARADTWGQTYWPE